MELVSSAAVHAALTIVRPWCWRSFVYHTSACNLLFWISPKYAYLFGTKLWYFIIWGRSLMRSMDKSSIPVNTWESINIRVGKFPAGFWRSVTTQTKHMGLKSMFTCRDTKNQWIFVVVSLVTFTNTSNHPPYICSHFFSYSYLTLPLVQLTQHICFSLILFCDPGLWVQFP